MNILIGYTYIDTEVVLFGTNNNFSEFILKSAVTLNSLTIFLIIPHGYNFNVK
uniref:Uncharacterized protein n=1 Tax=Meloidogyne incognita TaxID=6306 RepID=A0A914MUJ8_MELIC